jgi:hypothetical protein
MRQSLLTEIPNGTALERADQALLARGFVAVPEWDEEVDSVSGNAFSTPPPRPPPDATTGNTKRYTLDESSSTWATTRTWSVNLVTDGRIVQDIQVKTWLTGL